MFVDTHAHVNFDAFKGDSKEVLEKCLREQTWVINVGSQYSTSKRAVEIAQSFPEGVYAVVGLHPVHLFSMRVDEEESSFETREEKFDYQKYLELARDPKVLGIGECGLEYFHLPPSQEEEVEARQKQVFLEHIMLASETKKTLMVHSRDAYEDIYQIIKPRMSGLRAVVIHSFIGNWKQAEMFLDLGCFLSFNGIVTYKPRKEKKPGGSDPGLLEAVANTPLDKILLETDCPYLSPEPFRGQRNFPFRVKFVAEKIAAIKRLPVEEVERQTTANARKAFGF
ncbi:MAG: TatD family hydrolase [Candidatus Doudnabacteria bacterium]|nr:TatD family hydrolase [Candidatus Doudnabacteria bacterium]